jgi:hypothetical protein
VFFAFQATAFIALQGFMPLSLHQLFGLDMVAATATVTFFLVGEHPARGVGQGVRLRLLGTGSGCERDAGHAGAVFVLVPAAMLLGILTAGVVPSDRPGTAGRA